MASDISRVSRVGPSASMASAVAKDIAKREVAHRIKTGILDRNNPAEIEKDFRNIYTQEYYKFYAQYYASNETHSKIIYIPTDNLACKRYYRRHTVANFSKLNCFIHVHGGGITVGRINYPIDEDSSPETKEAFLSTWPGPLDKDEDQLKRTVTDYIDTLWQHDSQRRIRYCSNSYDEQRKTILKLLTELLIRDGKIDALGVTRLLLTPSETEIQKDDISKRPLETLQKYLLSGKRKEAIKFAKSKKLWDHAQCLAFLHKYQPQYNKKFHSDDIRLKDDTIVQLNEEFIASVDHEKLNIVYKALLARIYETDPESVNILKKPYVGEDAYEFAMLSANDCDMDFDQKNEIFKLIIAIKKVMSDPRIPMSYLISLGLSCLDANPDSSDNVSNMSHLSFKQNDTYASRTLAISNIDMLILNEVWEYCLNLARETCDRSRYVYIIELLPHKLIFASRLLDFGLHQMFYGYLNSINRIVSHVRTCPHLAPSDYDWDTIERSAEALNHYWELYLASPEAKSQVPVEYSMPSPAHHPSAYQPITQPELQSEIAHPRPPPPLFQQESYDYQPPLASMNHPMPSPKQSNYQQPRESDYNSNPFAVPVIASNEQPNSLENFVESRRQTRSDSHSQQHPPHQQPPAQQQPFYVPTHQPAQVQAPQQAQGTYNFKYTYSAPSASLSSPPERPQHQQSVYSDHSEQPTFDPPYSPINEHDNLTEQNSVGDESRRQSIDDYYLRNKQDGSGDAGGEIGSFADQNSRSSPQRVANGNSGTGANESQPAGDQQPGFLQKAKEAAKAFAASALSKSNSKQMILPPNDAPPMDWDGEKGKWVDMTKPEGAGNENPIPPPPMMSSPSQHSYTFANKSVKARYLKPEYTNKTVD